MLKNGGKFSVTEIEAVGDHKVCAKKDKTEKVGGELLIPPCSV